MYKKYTSKKINILNCLTIFLPDSTARLTFRTGVVQTIFEVIVKGRSSLVSSQIGEGNGGGSSKRLVSSVMISSQAGGLDETVSVGPDFSLLEVLSILMVDTCSKIKGYGALYM